MVCERSADGGERASAIIESHDEAVEIAGKLGPAIRGRIREAEALCCLPESTVEDLVGSGLCGVMRPRRYGGSELGAVTLIDVTVELASYCASTAWVYMLWAAHTWLQALWPASVQEEMFSSPRSLASSVVNTSGTVEAVEGGYVWTGRGQFSSGVDHCDWMTAQVSVGEKSAGSSRSLWLLVARRDLTIIDDWNPMGLRGTGSKTVLFDHVYVPSERALDNNDKDAGLTPGSLVNTNPMYSALPDVNLSAAMAAPAIGAAKGLLDEFGGKLERKFGRASGNDAPPVAATGMETTLSRYSDASARLDAAQALMRSNARLYSEVPAGSVSGEMRAKFRRDRAFAAQESRRAANSIFEESGATSLADGSDLQRIWRDVNAASAHKGLTWDWQASEWPRLQIGRVRQ